MAQRCSASLNFELYPPQAGLNLELCEMAPMPESLKKIAIMRNIEDAKRYVTSVADGGKGAGGGRGNAEFAPQNAKHVPRFAKQTPHNARQIPQNARRSPPDPEGLTGRSLPLAG
jgi:hypothetical protein